MISAFSSLQGATIIAAHATFSKMLTSFTLRTYQFLETDKERKEKIENNFHVQEFCKAQTNESEFAALLAAILLYLSQAEVSAPHAATFSIIGQIGYVWTRAAVGYPKVPTILFAVIRYAGLSFAVAELWKLAF